MRSRHGGSAAVRALSLSLCVHTWNLLIITCVCVCGGCRCRPGCGGVVDRETESSNGVAATSHGPPASLADHHTSEFVVVLVMKEFFPESCVPLPFYMLIHAGFKYSVKHLL